MTRPIPKVDYKDEIVNLGNHAGQILADLKSIRDADLYRVGPAIVQLKEKSTNPDELPVLLRKVKLASEDLDRAFEVLCELRTTIAELLK